MVAVKNHTASAVLETTTRSNDNILAVEVAYHKKIFRIILCYGPQEECKLDYRREFYDDLAIETENSIHSRVILNFWFHLALISNDFPVITLVRIVLSSLIVPAEGLKPRNRFNRFNVKSQVSRCSRPFPDLA